MRIIAGTKKRTALYGPNIDKIRPTTDRAKESLFNILNLKVKDSTFLDLFAGTGSISLEAKSRGAKEVYAIDKLEESISLIKKNRDKTKLDINVIKQDVILFLNSSKKIFDIIFMDPPFKISDEDILKMIDIIYENNLLKEEGILVIERASNKKNEEIFSKYENVQIRKYGKVSFIILGR